MTQQDVFAALNAAIDMDDLRDAFPGTIADELRKIVAGLLNSLSGSLTDEQKQAILDGIKHFFDTVVRPYNIPYIPAIPERMLEDWIWLSLESMIRAKLGI